MLRKRNSVSRKPNSVTSSDLPVLSNKSVGDEYWHLRLKAPAGHLEATPGQFFHLACPDSDRGVPFLRRPMSVYQVDRVGGTIAFLYKVTGLGTYGLSKLTAADSLGVMGPLGVGFRIDPNWNHALIVARGVGLATMGPLAPELERASVAVTSICSYRNRQVAVALDVFRDHGEVYAVFDTDGSSEVRRVKEKIYEIHSARPIDAVFTCGSDRLVRLLRELVCEFEIPGQVAVEQQMACALGMCHACVVDNTQDGVTESVRVCTSGPVFDLLEVA